MADGEEKSLPATPKRRAEARKQGQIARSPELGGAASLLALVLTMHVLLSNGAGDLLLNDFQTAFHFSAADTLTFTGAERRIVLAGLWASHILVPVLAVTLVLALICGIGQAGFQVNPEALTPRWQRVNPLSGVQRLFSPHGAVELVKGTFKLLVVGGLCLITLRDDIESGQLLALMGQPIPVTLGVIGSILWTLGLRVSLILFVLAFADYAYQKYEFEKGLRMSVSDIKQEMKQSEGNPQIKARVRKLQREMSKRRMMQEVPKATVVVTNPTHFAVALFYEAGMGAPKVVAKGQDEMARKIKEVAREHRVPLVENKPLAQALHKNVEIGREVPSELYEAVAQVLAFVFRSARRRPVRSSDAARPAGV